MMSGKIPRWKSRLFEVIFQIGYYIFYAGFFKQLPVTGCHVFPSSIIKSEATNLIIASKFTVHINLGKIIKWKIRSLQATVQIFVNKCSTMVTTSYFF